MSDKKQDERLEDMVMTDEALDDVVGGMSNIGEREKPPVEYISSITLGDPRKRVPQ